MRIALIIVSTACLATLGARPTTTPSEPRDGTFGFLDDFRIQHYLECAIELQKLEPEQRATQLKALAIDPKQSCEVYPLCRMLFEPKPKAEFRRPMIGSASFIGGGDYADWPLEPIALFENVPILVANGYTLAGVAESPERYLNYCLANCKWRDAKYELIKDGRRKEIIEKFVVANPKVKGDADWLRQQAE